MSFYTLHFRQTAPKSDLLWEVDLVQQWCGQACWDHHRSWMQWARGKKRRKEDAEEQLGKSWQKIFPLFLQKCAHRLDQTGLSCNETQLCCTQSACFSASFTRHCPWKERKHWVREEQGTWWSGHINISAAKYFTKNKTLPCSCIMLCACAFSTSTGFLHTVVAHWLPVVRRK